MEASATYINFHNEGAMQRCAITLKGATTTNRQAVHIIFLIDTSDSMNDGMMSRQAAALSKLDQVKRSIEFLLPLLLPTDFVSVISFGDISTIHCQQVAMNEEGRQQIQKVVRELRTDGCTNMSAGLLQIQEILDEVRTSVKQGVLLLTDGHANVGACTVPALENITQQIVNRNPSLTLTTIGYGQDHNTELMRAMAVAGSGSYNVVYNLEGIATTFGEVLGGLTTVVAQNVTIQLPYGSSPLTGYAIQNTGTHVLVKVGDIYAENEIIVLCDIPNNTITVKGVNMESLERLHILVSPSEAPEETPQNIQIAYYRYKVSKLLSDIGSSHISDEMKQKARDLLTELIPYNTSVLVQMMIDDLEQIVEQRANHIDMAQHAAYLSLGRGLRSENPHEEIQPRSFFSPPFQPMNNSGNDIDPILSQEDDFVGVNDSVHQTPRRNFSAVQSPFSNRVQNSHTITMRTSSQRDS